MLIKAGVDISRLSPKIRRVLSEVEDICKQSGDEIVVTSAYEGNHMAGSYHYSNDAFDFTGRYRIESVWASQLERREPSWVDVVFEGDHIHVEFDRRKYNKEMGV